MSPANSSSGRSYTSAQKDVVQRVFDCDATAYYSILNVEEDADAEEIKRAFKSLALLLHPDKNAAPQAEEAFKLVRQAWEVLSDDQERAAYDNERRGGFSSFFSSSFSSSFPSTADDSWSSSSARPEQPQQQDKPRRNENRKQRRRRQYEERMARQRQQAEERASAETEELLRRITREAARRGIRFWYCRQCDDVHIEGDVHVQSQSQSQSGRASQAPRPETAQDGGLYEALLTLIVMAFGLLMVLYALYYGIKFLFTSTFGKIVLGIAGIVTVLYFVPDPSPQRPQPRTDYRRPTPGPYQ